MVGAMRATRMAGLIALWAWAATDAAVISELLISPVHNLPRYIELDTSDCTGPIDLVILDGRPDASRSVMQVITINPAGAAIVVLHDGVWPLIPPASTHLQSVAPSLKLENAVGISRRLVLFDHVTGWGVQAPAVSTWTGIDDVLTYSTNKWPAASLLGETPLSLTVGDAVMRDRSAQTLSYTDTYLVGPIDASLHFISNARELNPGLVNVAHAPEPTTAAIMLATLALTLRRRRTQQTQP